MSTLTVTNIKKTGETASRDASGVAAAWANFDGTGTVAIRDSMNVASITDDGTGVYRLGLSNSFSNINYSGAGSSWRPGIGFGFLSAYSFDSTTEFTVTTGNSGGGFSDNAENSAQTWGDLA